MTEQEVTELAAILVNEHGHEAVDIARRRRDQHARERQSESFQLWHRIAEAASRLLRMKQRETA